MKVHVKVFPTAGLCDETKKVDIDLEEGNMSELQLQLQEQLGASPHQIEGLMFLHNGFSLDKHKEVAFQDGDQLWLLPLLSGG